MVMVLVSLLDVLQNLEGLRGRCRFDEHLLKSPFQCAVFLNRVAILVERGRSDALYGAPGKGRLHDIGGIHTAGGRSCANHRVYLIDEYNDVGILLKLFQQCPDALLKLSAILRSGHDGGHVEAHHAAVEQHRRGLSLGNELREALDNGTFTHSRFTY